MGSIHKIIFLFCSGFCCGYAANAKSIQDTKYATWYPCIIIAQKDTLAGKMKPKEKDQYFGKGPFTMVFQNGKERVIKPSDIAQLWMLMHTDTDRYLSVTVKPDAGGIKTTVLYRLIVDGPCKLLYSEGVRPDHVFSLTYNWQTSLDRAHIFTIYYHGEMWEFIADTQNMLDPDTDFQGLGKEVFKECPAVAYKVTTNQANKEDVRNIIAEFNNCISANK